MKRIIFTVALILLFSPKLYASANYALLFDGIDDFVRVPDTNSLDLSTGMTIEAWIKSSLVSDNGPRVIVSKWNDPSGEWSYIFKDHNSSDKLRIELSKGGHNDLADLEGSTSVITGGWIHVAATYDMTNVRLFYNGAQDNVGLPKTGGGSIKNSITILHKLRNCDC